MAVKPVLMVLYTNDAVEVRYSDQSRLHILPCGTSFTYHTLTESHPVHGMSTVQQRSCFVTSQYRDQLIAALDFRNRFAERPFLCPELIAKDDIVNLYAKILQVAWPKSPSSQHCEVLEDGSNLYAKILQVAWPKSPSSQHCEVLEDGSNLYAKILQIAWPKSASRQHCEVLEDGSVRITSMDEFASLILSPHRKDFTVCYLSLISRERQREGVKLKKQRQAERVKSKVKDVRSDGKLQELERCRDKNTTSALYNDNQMHDLISAKTPARNIAGNPDGNPNGIEDVDLNISPITQASVDGSPSGVSHASGSPITPLDAVKDNDAKFRPFSTPTEEIENLGFIEQCLDVKGKRTKHLAVNREGSFLGEDYNENCNKKDIGHTNQTTSSICNSDTRIGPLSNSSKSHRESRMDHDYIDAFQQKPGNCSFTQAAVTRVLSKSDNIEENTLQNSSSDSVCSSGSSVSDRTERETRCSYCWVTRHISRDECPLVWSHIVKMAEHIAEKKEDFTKTGDDPKQPESKSIDVPSKLRKIKKDECIHSDVPSPLPLTCHGQHLHKTHNNKKVLHDSKNPIEDWRSLSQGHLKVILVDGVIYRIVRLQTINIVEVYPGDGSVLVSQGMNAHFFQHIIPAKDKIEERTYSVKSPPQSVAGNHSVKSLMNRAHRLLAHVRQEVNMPSLNTGLCCWKHEELQLEEPMSTVLLEDCTIPGYGKFTAMSNGQIRIVFNDRTALDMTCDFSKRLKSCMDHSLVEGSVLVPNKKAGMCRLLLPNGHYQMVDISHPGQYKKYIQMAKEWSDWVNSSPGERKTFYRERLDSNMNVCVDRELQKIKCFNYVVDNTVLNKNGSASSNSATGDKEPSVRPGILRHVDNHTNSDRDCYKLNTPARSVQIHSPPNKHSAGVIAKPCNSSLTQAGVTRFCINTNNSLHNTTDHLTLSSVRLDTGSVVDSTNHAHVPPTSARLNPIGQCQPTNVTVERYHVSSNMIGQNKPIRSFVPQDLIGQNKPIRSFVPQDNSSLEGFNAVRQALLKTSNVIKDLDSLLDKK